MTFGQHDEMQSSCITWMCQWIIFL